MANLDQILCVASIGLGKGCIMFWGRLDQDCGVHGNRKPPLTYNGENDVSTFSRLLLIRSFFILAGKEVMHKISDEFEFRPDRTTGYGVSCLKCLKMSHRLIMGKWCLHASSFIFDRIISKVAGNQDRHKSSEEFDIGSNQTTHYGVTCPLVTKILHIWTWISLKPVGQSWSNLMCSIIGEREKLRKILGQIGSKLWIPWQQKAPIGLKWGRWCLHLFSVAFDPILFILAGNEGMHKMSDEFEFRQVRTTAYGVSCPWGLKISHRQIMGKWYLQASSFIFDRIIINVAGN